MREEEMIKHLLIDQDTTINKHSLISISRTFFEPTVVIQGANMRLFDAYMLILPVKVDLYAFLCLTVDLISYFLFCRPQLLTRVDIHVGF